MTHPLLRPRWILGHAVAVLAVAGFVVLGMWQLRRYDEKLMLRSAVEVALLSDPIPIASASPGGYTRVLVGGSFDSDWEQLVPRSRDGVSGYEVVAPLRLDSGDTVLVDRGWVGLDEEPDVPPSRIDGEGVLWPGESGPVPAAFSRYASRIDPGAVAAASGYPLRPEYLILTTQVPHFEIEPPRVEPVSLGPHLGYAGQWFLFIGVVVVGYPVLLRRRARSAAIRG